MWKNDKLCKIETVHKWGKLEITLIALISCGGVSTCNFRANYVYIILYKKEIVKGWPKLLQYKRVDAHPEQIIVN